MLGSLVLFRCLFVDIYWWLGRAFQIAPFTGESSIGWLLSFIYLRSRWKWLRLTMSSQVNDISGQLRSPFCLFLSSFHHLQLFYVRQQGIWNSFASLDKGFRRIAAFCLEVLPFISKKNYNKYVFHLTKFQLIDIDPLSSSSFEFINVYRK